MPTNRSSMTARRARGAAALFAVVAVAGSALAVRSALAAPKPPQPTITSGPTGSVASTTARFTYSDTQANVTFQCSLDGSGYSSCPNNGKVYNGMANGPHTFSVVAQSTAGALSSPATRSWTVDVVPPALSLAFPASNGSYNAAGWAAGCAPAGICGTATDATGVQRVEVAVFQGATPSGYSTATLASPGATSTAWRLAMALPADGSWTAKLRATDTLGTTTAAGSEPTSGFRVDTAPPPAPVITAKPEDPTSQRDARFEMTDAEAGAALQCRLDGASFGSCGPAVDYKNLAVDRHCFDVRARDGAGNTSATTTYCWTILLSSFPISGNVEGLFYPGRTNPLNLVITNPFNFTLRVTSVAITVNQATSKPGCVGPDNLQVTRSLARPADVPANSTRSLEQLGLAPADWPQLTMPNLATNQDACKAATFSLRYVGQGTKP